MKSNALHSVQGWHRFATCVRRTGYKSVPRGFTLVEMLVVISIIAILVTIVVGVTHIVLARASAEETRTNMQVILQAIEAFRETDETNDYPPSTAGTPDDHNAKLYKALKDNPAARKILGPLPDDAIRGDRFVDGFGMRMDYSSDGGVGGAPVLISAGADSDFGTAQDNIRSDNQ